MISQHPLPALACLYIWIVEHLFSLLLHSENKLNLLCPAKPLNTWGSWVTLCFVAWIVKTKQIDGPSCILEAGHWKQKPSLFWWPTCWNIFYLGTKVHTGTLPPDFRKAMQKALNWDPEACYILYWCFMLLLLLLSHFSRVRLCVDSIDSSPPGSPIPGILQARTLEWVAISFSNAWKWKVKSESEVTQSCLTLSNPMDHSLPGSSVHGIFQARVPEWGAIAFSGCFMSPSSKISGLWHSIWMVTFTSGRDTVLIRTFSCRGLWSSLFWYWKRGKN